MTTSPLSALAELHGRVSSETWLVGALRPRAREHVQQRPAELEKAEQLNKRPQNCSQRECDTGETAVKYVPLTVLFALVLFLIAAGQRYRQQPVRISANALAVCLLVYTLVYMIILPRFRRTGGCWPGTS